MKKFIFFLLLLVILPVSSFADYPKLPVISLSYDFSYGTEEEEESGTLMTDSLKHTIVLRIKEELARTFYFAFPFQYTLKDYTTEENMDNNYYYLKFSPYCSWDMTDKVTIKLYITGKWFDYEFLDSSEQSKDFYTMSTQIAWTYKVFQCFKILSHIKSEYNFYVNPGKQSQLYDFQLGGSLQINKYTITGKYDGEILFPMGDASEKEIDSLHTFKIDMTLDLNK
jgi:hypothetical protein